MFSRENASSCRACTFLLHLLVKTRAFSSIIETKPKHHHHQTYKTPIPAQRTHRNQWCTHLIARHPHADTQRHLAQTCTHINRGVVTDFVGRLSCVEKFAMTYGLAPKRQRFGNHDDLVSVPVLDVSSASVNTTQTYEKNKFTDDRCSARLLF